MRLFFWKKNLAAVAAFSLFSTFLFCQTNPPAAVLKHLDEWSDWKFGLLMHWGPYSEWGVVESWSLCPEPYGWCERRWHAGLSQPKIEGEMPDYFEYKTAYEHLQNRFNPTRFDPEKWAAAAQKAGMKYVVFTTKHHDGFSMFDTKQTDYRVTGPQCAFSKNAKSDVAKAVFEAFRAKNMGIGAYFSKPDWHSSDFWSPEFPPKDRNVNYKITERPEKWKRFQDFTFRQIEELVTGYGPLDILWFDGGWVRPDSVCDRSSEWERDIPHGQDIDMKRIAAMARGHQPDIILVDRAVPGPFQDYLTPEQEVPEKPLAYRWETCMTMGDSWSYVPNDHYKSTNKLIHLLIDIVAKGGNFLLNIGPDPSGELPTESLTRLAEIGDWMAVNQDAIYATRPVEPYKSGKICFTQKKDGRVFAIYLADEGETTLPNELVFPLKNAAKSLKMRLLGTSSELKWESRADGQVVVRFPKNAAPSKHAWVVEISK